MKPTSIVKGVFYAALFILCSINLYVSLSAYHTAYLARADLHKHHQLIVRKCTIPVNFSEQSLSKIEHVNLEERYRWHY